MNWTEVGKRLILKLWIPPEESCDIVTNNQRRNDMTP
jgi:hypothetical protein